MLLCCVEFDTTEAFGYSNCAFVIHSIYTITHSPPPNQKLSSPTLLLLRWMYSSSYRQNQHGYKTRAPRRWRDPNKSNSSAENLSLSTMQICTRNIIPTNQRHFIICGGRWGWCFVAEESEYGLNEPWSYCVVMMVVNAKRFSFRNGSTLQSRWSFYGGGSRKQAPLEFAYNQIYCKCMKNYI